MPLLPLEMYPLTYRINILHGDSHFCLIKSACFSKVWSVACLLYFWQEVHSTDLRKREASTYLYLDGQGRVPMVPFTMKYIIIIITIIIIVIITIIIIIYMTYISISYYISNIISSLNSPEKKTRLCKLGQTFNVHFHVHSHGTR
jgi:hypothetical protein